MSNNESTQVSFSFPYWDVEFMSELIKYGVQGMTNAGRFHPGVGINFIYDQFHKQEGEFLASLVKQYIQKMAEETNG